MSLDARSARALAQRLQSLADAGVTTLPKAGRPAPAVATSPMGVASPAATASRPQSPTSGPSHELAILRQQVAGCTRCAELAATRTLTVFGAGDPAARLCFLGEAPGADEDVSGEPFVGRAGQLLTKIIEACTFTREQVYILNVLKCRPPGNRTPDPVEVVNCRPFLERQLEVIAPEFICCLGTTAAHALLGTTEAIGRLRRRWFTHGAAQVMCTYHPSYLLRNPAAKKDVWEDMKMLMERMGVTL